jgi:hypothetical protein
MKTILGILAMAFAVTAHATGNLENPVKDNIESGISVINGWHCTAKEIRIYVDGQDYGKAGSGTNRFDTAPICGHHETGFSRLVNWSVLTPGQHTISVYADGQLLETRQFHTTRSGGEAYATGLSKTIEVSGFPTANKSAVLKWNESKQGFVVTAIHDTSNSNLDGTYDLYRSSMQDVFGNIVDSEQVGVSVSGTLVKKGSTYTETVTMTINGETGTGTTSGFVTDNGYYLYDLSGQLRKVVVERGPRLVVSYLAWLDGVGYINFIEYWARR